MTDDAIAVLRIELEGIEPLIWRRVAVPNSISLKALHGVIQIVMGWHDCHLWQLEANHRRFYSLPIPGETDWNERITDASRTTLSSVIADGVTEMAYTYDMGDDWRHRIVIERVTPATPGTQYPQFLGGERRCPPEDCGGVPGYYEFLANVGSKNAQKRKAALDWYGSPYDPDDIDEKQTIMNLTR